MRRILFLICVSSYALVVCGEDPGKEQPFVWHPPFGAVSASQPFSLVVTLITNDSVFDVGGGDADRGKTPPPWCQAVFQRSYLKLMQKRPDLKDRCFVQFLPVGTPRLVTGGNSRNQPQRAFVAICDGDYRLLSLLVGVPSEDELLTMIEDAQEVHSMLELNKADKMKTQSEIADRSSKRMTRLWQDALKEMLVAINAGNANPGGGGDSNANALLPTLGRIAMSFEEVYLSDVRLRFGLTDFADRTRLVILEQHAEARRPWCEAMMPFVAGTDFTTTWKPLIETVWYAAPVRADADADDLLAWWDTQSKDEQLVLSIEPPLLVRQTPWPPVDVGSVAEKKGLGWRDLQKLVLEFPYRNVDTEQLAVLIRDRGLQPLDLHLPTRTRYLFFEPGKKTPFAIREGDIPGKPIGRLRRAKKND